MYGSAKVIDPYNTQSEHIYNMHESFLMGVIQAVS